MKKSIQIKLSLMMFLEFFIWGGWFVTLGTFLGRTLSATDPEIAQAFSTQSWGAIVAPFIIGLIADRYFNAERILGFLHLIGAGLLYAMYSSANFEKFYPFVLGYMILYMPTLALVNSVSFNQMNDPSAQFPRVRVFGTIGWIVAAFLVTVFGWDGTSSIDAGALRNTFLMAAIASAIMGIFSFMLPKTPPKISRQEKPSISSILGLDALKLLNNKNFLVFFLASVLICIPLAFYYQNISPFLTENEVSGSTAWTTVGQMSEVFFMLLLPVFFKRYGVKKTLLIGMLAWVVRYVLFAYGNGDDLFFLWVLGIALHGICYDFFFVSGQIYTDNKAGQNYKSAAQGLITLATYGVGMLIGFWVSGQIVNQFKIMDNAHHWDKVWLYPAIFATGVLLLFLWLFKNEKIAYKS